jgi:hypothetical protein
MFSGRSEAVQARVRASIGRKGTTMHGSENEQAFMSFYCCVPPCEACKNGEKGGGVRAMNHMYIIC